MMEDAMTTPRKDRRDIVRPKTRLGKRQAALLRELNYIDRATSREAIHVRAQQTTPEDERTAEVV